MAVLAERIGVGLREFGMLKTAMKADDLVALVHAQSGFTGDRRQAKSPAPNYHVGLHLPPAGQHHAAFDYFPAVRHGYRVTTIGEAPTLEPLS